MPALQSGRPPLARRLWGARGQITSNHGATHKVYGGNKSTHVLGLVPSLPCTALPCLPPSSRTPDVQPCRTTTAQNISAYVQRNFPPKTLTFRYICVRARVRVCACACVCVCPRRSVETTSRTAPRTCSSRPLGARATRTRISGCRSEL